jgi:Recombinase/Resolvase, N terminal domain
MLLVENFDRLSRSPVMTALALFQSIVSRGITIVTLSDGMVYSTESVDANWTQLIFALAKMASAHGESAEKGKKVKATWDRKRANGEILTSVCPSWLRLRDGKWELIGEKVHIVQELFELAASGQGTPTIARGLNARKVPTLGHAVEWNPALVAAVLKNKSVIGVMTPKKANADPIDGYYPPILKSNVFYEVQGHIRNRDKRGGRKGTGVANLFAGMTYCYCGRKVRFVSGSKPHLYLRCLSAYSNTGCDAPTMPYSPIEEAVFDWLASTDIPVMSDSTRITDPMISIRAELEDARTRLENLLDVASKSKSVGLAARIDKVEAQILVLQDRLRTEVPKRVQRHEWSEAISLLEQQQALRDAGDLEPVTALRLKLQASLRRLVEQVVLHKDQRTTKYGTKVRPIEIRGPLAEAIRERVQLMLTSDRRMWGTIEYNAVQLTDDSVIIEYELPPQGFQPGNVRGRRKKT